MPTGPSSMPRDNTTPSRLLVRRAVGLLSALLLMGSVALWSAWIVGVIWTDRALMSQYVSWAGALLLLASILLVLPGLLLSFAWPRSRGVRSTRRLVAGVVISSIGVWCWYTFRLGAIFVPTSPAPDGRAIAIMHWNASKDPGVAADQYLGTLVAEPTPDVLVITGWMSVSTRNMLLRHVGPGATQYIAGGMGVFSRVPITSGRSIAIDVTAARESEAAATSPWVVRLGRRVFSHAHVSWRNSTPMDIATLQIVKLDTVSQLGRPLVVYAIDLPSNPMASRRRAAEIIARQIESLQTGPDPIEMPDLLVGDFNTPAGSFSLSLLAPRMCDASSGAGVGLLATWPRERPLLLIDHAFVASWLRPSGYRIVDPARTEHRAQRFEITPRKTAP